MNTYFLLAFATLLIAAGAYHFINPAPYLKIMPDFLPGQLANWAGGAAEIVIGVLMWVPATRGIGTWAACALMVAFLPVHVVDLMRERPVIGSKVIAAVRLVAQFALIYWLYRSAVALTN